MTMTSNRYPAAGTVEINSRTYTLVRNADNQPMLNMGVSYLSEPPYLDGTPPLLSEPMSTWHLGGFKSRQGIPGTSEYGKNRDARWAFRLLPSAKINVVTLQDSVTEPYSRGIFEVDSYVYVLAGRYAYRIDPTTDAVVLSKDFGASVVAIAGVRWEEDYGLVTTDQDTLSLWKVVPNGGGAGIDTWTQTADVTAYRLAVGINRLFKVTKTSELKNISTGLNPLVDANWADQVQVGEVTTLATSIVAYERTVFVGKPEGLFAVGDDGFGIPVIKRMPREDLNCIGMVSFDPYIIVPHVRGLYRYLPGVVESIGLERELLNESPVNGRWLNFAPDGNWLYGSMVVDGESYINVGRENRGNEPGFQNFIWDTLLWFEASTSAMHISAITDPARLYFGHGVNVAYIELSNSPGSYEYSTAGGSHYTSRMRFDDWNSKDVPYVDLIGTNLSATKYWLVNYSIDGAAFSSLDIDDAQMKLIAAGRRRFHLPTTAVGREVQFRFDWVSDSATLPPELNYIEPFVRPQSHKMEVYTFQVKLEQGVRTERARELRSSKEQAEAFITLSETAGSVIASGPWGKDLSLWVQGAKIVSVEQEGQDDPSYIMELSLQLREASS